MIWNWKAMADIFMNISLVLSANVLEWRMFDLLIFSVWYVILIKKFWLLENQKLKTLVSLYTPLRDMQDIQNSTFIVQHLCRCLLIQPSITSEEICFRFIVFLRYRNRFQKPWIELFSFTVNLYLYLFYVTYCEKETVPTLLSFLGPNSVVNSESHIA